MVEDTVKVVVEVGVEVDVVDGLKVDVEVVPIVEVTCSGLQLLTRSIVLICSDLHSLNSVSRYLVL